MDAWKHTFRSHAEDGGDHTEDFELVGVSVVWRSWIRPGSDLKHFDVLLLSLFSHVPNLCPGWPETATSWREGQT